MIHLLSHIGEIRDRVRGKNIFLFLDYDGTIAPIADTPDKAVLPRRVRAVVQRLSAMRGVKVAVVTGRSLRDIKKMVGIRGVIYAGNHGLEIEHPDFKYEVFVPQHVKMLLKGLKVVLKDDLNKVKGVLIEDKGLAVAIHYRNVEGAHVRFIKDTIGKRMGPQTHPPSLRIDEGKKVYEMRPAVAWTKGDAVSWLISRFASESFDHRAHMPRILRRIFPRAQRETRARARHSMVPVYIGDDVTDENGFQAVAHAGISVFVGDKKSSRAKYYVKNTDEVFAFLTEIGKAVCSD